MDSTRNSSQTLRRLRSNISDHFETPTVVHRIIASTLSCIPAGRIEEGRHSETIDFRKLPSELSTATQFLKDHDHGRIKTKGNQILVEGFTHKEVKLLLHKFLRHRSLDGYRVLSHSGILEIAPLHHVEPSRPEGGTVPPAAATMPYFFPGTPGPVPVERKTRKKPKP